MRLTWEAYKNFREHTPEFVDLAALQAGNAALGVRRAGSQAQADTFNGQEVSGNFFRTLGVQPWIGRMMTDADDQLGAPPVAVMSYRTWQSKYGSDPSVVGASFQINEHVYELSVEHHVRNEIKFDHVENWDINAPQTEEEAGESPEALSLEINDCRNLTIANYHGYRVTRSRAPFPAAVRVYRSSDIHFRNVHE